MAKPTAEQLIEGLAAGQVSTLARAITLAESHLPADQATADQVLAWCRQRAATQTLSFRLGITGPPGVGKSTAIDQLGLAFIERGHRVAVLAVDPSSRRTGGSILGDKTRMNRLSQHPRAFIRPSAAGSTLGGLHRSTRQAIDLCEAAGFDRIIVETVGVGQSEITVHELTDCFLLLALPGSGDEVQGIKRGIIEMADLVAVTKADGDNLSRAQRTRLDLQQALHYYPPQPSGWVPRVCMVSAFERGGLEPLLEALDDRLRFLSEQDRLAEHRKSQRLRRFETLVAEKLLAACTHHLAVELQAARQAILYHDTLPEAQAQTLVAYFVHQLVGSKEGTEAH